MHIVAEVWESSGKRDFLQLPDQIYGPESPYCPPLDVHLKQVLGRIGEPEKHLLVAYQDGRPVARMGLKRHRHGAYDALHFGFYEALPEGPEATVALVREARRRYPHLPLRGNYHFRLEDPYTGVLVDGFDEEPYFFMSYNPPYYDEYLSAAGLRPTMDLYSYEYRSDKVRLDMLKPRADRARQQGFRVRTMDGARLDAEAQLLASVFNDALADNWGYEVMEQEQIKDLVTLGRLFLDPRLVFFVEKDGETAGCAILLPNFNPLIKRCRGRLGPRFLWDYLLHRRRLDTFRGYAMGVRTAYLRSDVSSLLADAVMQLAKIVPWKAMEISWVLASNRAMNLLALSGGGRRTKTYRLYEMT